MSQRYQGGFLTASYFPLKVPDAPTIGTATAGTSADVSVTFTAPSNVGGGAITSYLAIATDTSSGATFTGTGASSPVVVGGLTVGASYTVKVSATNAFGAGPLSAASNSITAALAQQVAYTTAGTYTWIAPSGLSPATVSVVAVGGGGGGSEASGGGGGLGYLNNYSVTSGSSYTVVVGVGGTTGSSGGDSYFVSTGTLFAGGGQVGSVRFGNAAGGTYTGTGGGNGGVGGQNYEAGGGGAGGYSGTGGRGGDRSNSPNGPTAGSGGGGGGGRGGGSPEAGGGGGGGVGILGSGSNGAAGASNGNGGGGGSSGTSGANGETVGPYSSGGGGLYGGGAGFTGYGGSKGDGAVGAVRIIYSTTGVSRSFPSTNTGNL